MDMKISDLIRSLRPHQWLKNLIIFVPAITAHRFDAGTWVGDVAGFGIFCMAASSMYLVNDCLDLNDDQVHGTKRHRPIASGAVSRQTALAVALVLGSTSLCCGFVAGIFEVAVAYIALALAYSVILKLSPMLNVFSLTGLYTLRLVAGHELTGIPYSSWLLMFCLFLFLGLAFLKRATESDCHWPLGEFGVGSGFAAVIVLALYVNSPQVLELYQHPMWLLALCPLLLYWICHVWHAQSEGKMDSDPVWFAAKDLTSYIIGAGGLAVLWLAAGDKI